MLEKSRVFGILKRIFPFSAGFFQRVIKMRKISKLESCEK
jgi:hypothetical protein